MITRILAAIAVVVVAAAPALAQNAQAPASCGVCKKRTYDRSISWIYVVQDSGKLNGVYCDTDCQKVLRCSACGRSAFKTRSTQDAMPIPDGKGKTITVSYGSIPDPAQLRCETCVKTGMTAEPAVEAKPDKATQEREAREKAELAAAAKAAIDKADAERKKAAEAEAKAAAAKPVETKPAETKPSEVKPAAKPAEPAKPVEPTKPAPVATKPAPPPPEPSHGGVTFAIVLVVLVGIGAGIYGFLRFGGGGGEGSAVMVSTKPGAKKGAAKADSSAKGSSPKAAAPAEKKPAASAGPKPWFCRCGAENAATEKRCKACSNPKPAATAS